MNPGDQVWVRAEVVHTKSEGEVRVAITPGDGVTDDKVYVRTEDVQPTRAEYAFTFDVIASDNEGYYYDRWDRANRYEVIGATKQAALDALWPIVGASPRGRSWKARQVGAAKDARLS